MHKRHLSIKIAGELSMNKNKLFFWSEFAFIVPRTMLFGYAPANRTIDPSAFFHNESITESGFWDGLCKGAGSYYG